MPIYEYVCEKDGTTLELLRPMSAADDPVPDPEGKGRVFTRKRSTVSLLGGNGGPATATARHPGGHVHSSTCGCGKPRGACGLP